MGRKCDNCGKDLPSGCDIVQVRVLGRFGLSGKGLRDFDFCKPECFEEFFARRRYKLITEEESKR